MGMSTQGNSPNPEDERTEDVELARDNAVKGREAPKGEMVPQDETDRSLDVDAVRRELARHDPSLCEHFEKRDEKPNKEK